MNDILPYLGLLQISERIRRKEVSSVEVTRMILERIDACDGALGSYMTVLPERALEKARQADVEIQKGFYRGGLHGVPVGVKDVFDTSFLPSTAGMPIYKNHIPATDATVIERLQSAGAIVVGKHATTEGIYQTHHNGMRTPKNPRNKDYWTGVSSSGSAVATAAGLCFGAVGTDTGGSIRIPSAVNGLTGLKPTWGRISRAGLLPLSPTLDHAGPIARNARDVAAILQVIAGHDVRDPTSVHGNVPDYVHALDTPIHGLRIGLDLRFATDGVDPEVARAFSSAVDVFKTLGATIFSTDLPAMDRLFEHGATIFSVEGALSHKSTYPSRVGEYGEALANMLDHGHSLSSFDIAEAMQKRAEYTGEFAAVFDQIDILVTPAMPIKVPTLERMPEVLENQNFVAKYSMPFNMTGQPALTLPCGLDSEGHPIGLQLVGRHLAEEQVLRAAHAYQTVTDWHTRYPVVS